MVPRKTASEHRAQTTDPAKTASAILKRKQTAARKRISAFASGNGSKKTVSRSAAALKRLGVSEETLAAAPAITPVLKRAEGGLKQVIAAMRLAQADKVIAMFLKKYDSIPVGDRERLPIEAIALAARVDVTHLLGSIMLALQAQAVNLTRIIAMTNHPNITAARVKYGLMPSGERDRAALDTAMGFLPSRRGATFIGQAIFDSGKGVMERRLCTLDHDDASEFNEDEPDLDKLFPPPRIMQEKLARIRESVAQHPERREVLSRPCTAELLK